MRPSTVGRPTVRIRDLTYGQQFVTVVSGKKVLVEVIYVRPKKRFGDRRIVLRRVGGGVLAEARELSELSQPPR